MLCKWPDTQLRRLVGEYESGDSYLTLARRYGCSLATISRSLKRAECTPRLKICGLDTHYFDTLDTPEKCYWFGFLCADGYADRLRIIVGLKASDRSHLERFRAAIGSTHTISERDYTGPFGRHQSVNLQISSKYLAARLMGHGLYSIKSGDATPLQQVSYLQSWLAGYWDGDGWLCFRRISGHRKCQWGLCGPQNMMEFVNQLIATSCRIEPGKVLPHKSTNKIVYLRYEGSYRVVNIMEWLNEHSIPHLERKYAKYNALKESFDAA